MRYKDKLEFEIKADPSITQVPIIRLVLQPLVENAIYHGLKYKDSKGLLTVHGYMKGENAVIDITDDGVGMDEETLKHIYDKHKVNYRSMELGCTMCSSVWFYIMEKIMALSITVKKEREPQHLL